VSEYVVVAGEASAGGWKEEEEDVEDGSS